MSEETTADVQTVSVPPLSKGKRAFFEDDTASYGSKVVLDGETFYFNALSEEGLKYEREWPVVTAQLLGMDLEEFKNTQMFTDPRQSEIFTKQSRALWDTVLSDALKDWTLSKPCTETAKLKLMPDIKRDIADAIIAFSKFGISEARFRQLRSASANQR